MKWTKNNSLNLYLNYENTNQQFKKFTSASGPFSYLGIYNVDRKSASLTYNGQNDNSNYMLSATYGELKKRCYQCYERKQCGKLQI
mgnify:CR=1 FL=1